MQRRATVAQAKLLARLWIENRELQSSDHYNSPTERAIIKHRWVRLSGNTGTYPSGTPWTGYQLTPEGMKAIAWTMLEHVRTAKPSARGGGPGPASV